MRIKLGFILFGYPIYLHTGSQPTLSNKSQDAISQIFEICKASFIHSLDQLALLCKIQQVKKIQCPF